MSCGIMARGTMSSGGPLIYIPFEAHDDMIPDTDKPSPPDSSDQKGGAAGWRRIYDANQCTVLVLVLLYS